MKFLLAIFLSILIAPLFAASQLPISWVELGPNGVTIARTISTAKACPTITLDGQSQTMQLRVAADHDYPVTVCQATIPATVKTASILGQNLALPKTNPRRIVILGDTGCRLKLGAATQACNDPNKWPFAKIAANAATFHPDLVIHLGDYHYREMPCPFWDSGCKGSPHGYNWASWNADFFTPAQPLLNAAPWIVVRGNHEDCKRAWQGWARFLNPFPYSSSCQPFSSLYSLPIGNIQLYVLDSSSAADLSAPDKSVAALKSDFDIIRNSRAQTIWIATHKPLWVTLNPSILSTLQAASENKFSPATQLLLAGHVHEFQTLNFTNRPAQVVVGNGGTNLEFITPPHNTAGAYVAAQPVIQGISLKNWGYLTLEKTDTIWQGQMRDINGNILANCQVKIRQFVCHIK